MIQKDAVYKDLTITIDTREKSSERINHVKEWFFERGGAVQMGTVKAADYSIVGTYKGRYIDIGIEFKTILDLCLNWQTLKERFTRTCVEYEKASLFIMGAVRLHSNEETGKLFVKVEGTNDDVTLSQCFPYEAYHHNLKEWTNAGILINQFDFLYMFGPNIDMLLKYLVNYPFSGVRLADEDPMRMYYSMYMQVLGLGPKSVFKVAEHSPKYWLENVEEMRKKIGVSKSKKLIDALEGQNV